MKQPTIPDLHKIYKRNVVKYPFVLNPLAEQLGVSVTSLLKLEVGLNPHNQSWIFPERDSRGVIIGLTQRLLNGSKLMIKGSKRGLTYVLNQTGEQYVSGKQNWTRVSSKLPCPLCGKPDGCLLPAGQEADPPAVVCVHIAEGAVKTLKLGHLHILDPQRNICRSGVIMESTYPILVVEGASDVAAALDLGFVAIGRPSAEGKTDLLIDVLRNKNVVIIGENDAGAGKRGMEAAFRTLRPVCKSILKVLPPNNAKDIREWKNKLGLTTEKLLEWVTKTGDKSYDASIFEDDVASTIAEAWLKQKKTHGGSLTFRNLHGQWVDYVNNCYEYLESESFRGQLYQFLDSKRYCKVGANGEVTIQPYKPTRAKVNDIIDALSQWCPIIEEPPLWLNKEIGLDPLNLIAFKNGILDVNKYIDGEICLYNPTPEFFTFDVFPYDFDENADSKLWHDFIGDIYNGDTSKSRLLSQWFGYNCVPDLSFEKLMLFTGRPRSGKSTVLESLQAMLGERQCCETSFQSLAGPFGYQPLLNKYAAIIGDAKSPRAGEANAVLEKILHITGGDAVSINRKNLKEIPITHLKCRFTIAMNDLPAFTDHARALEPRLNILCFPNSYVGKEDWTLKRRLKADAAKGKLINFALQGLRDLRTSSDFVTPRDSRLLMKQFQELASPVVSFIAECCEHEPPDSKERYVVTKDQLYDIWAQWCGKQGRKPGYKEQFGRWFVAACPEAITVRARLGEKRVYAFGGIRLAKWVAQEYVVR